jgi:integrase
MDTIHANDIKFYDEVNQIIQEEPAGHGARAARTLGRSRARLRCAARLRPPDRAARDSGDRHARQKHGGAVEAPYTADAFGHLVRQTLQRLATELAARPGVSPADLVQLANTSAHAFRHTFGTCAVARDMPIDVVQTILGHASLQTTSIYVRAEQRRVLEAAARYYADERDGRDTG